MEFSYRATPTKPSETVLDAFHRLVSKYDIVDGNLFPQPRAMEALAPLRDVCGSAGAFVLDIPLHEPASKHWALAAERVEARGTNGLEQLMMLYGTLEKTVAPWKELAIPISIPLEQAVRSGFDFVSGRAVFEVSLDYSRASMRPAFRADAARISESLKLHREALFRDLPAEPTHDDPLSEHRWGKPETGGGPAFLTKWLAEHPTLDRLTIHINGTVAALLEHADLFPAGVEHQVMAFTDQAVPVPVALEMFEANTYRGLLSFTAKVADNPHGVRSLCLQLSEKGLALEVSSPDELGPKVGKSLDLKLKLTDVD